MTTLKQIAKAAGVDVSVASRALNPKPDLNARVASTTTEKIRRIANELKYQPNRAAEFLKRGKNPAIGAFLPVFAPSLFKGLVIGITEATAAAGFPVIFHFDLTPDEYRRFLENTPDVAHCGLITSPYHAQEDVTDQLIKRFRDAQGKLVAVHYRLNLPGVCTVAIDDLEGGRIAAKHLLSRKCTTFIGYNLATTPTIINWRSYRARGFSEALQAAGVQPTFHKTSPADRAAICAVCKHHTSAQPAGIFCASDSDAVQLMGALQQEGITVGQNALVIGYDDLHLTADLTPALTTLHQPMREIGALAACKVINMIYGIREDSVLIPPRLIIRASA